MGRDAYSACVIAHFFHLELSCRGRWKKVPRCPCSSAFLEASVSQISFVDLDLDLEQFGGHLARKVAPRNAPRVQWTAKNDPTRYIRDLPHVAQRKT